MNDFERNVSRRRLREKEVKIFKKINEDGY
jgi:hypothetical protein